MNGDLYGSLKGGFSQEDIETDKTLSVSDMPADGKASGDALKKKANGEGITLSINESGGLRVTYDDGK